MRILFVTDSFPCVSQTFVLDQITGLIDRGQEVEILSFGQDKEGFQPEVEEYDLLDKTKLAPQSESRSKKILSIFYLVFVGIFLDPGLALKAIFLCFKKQSLLPIYLAYLFLGSKKFDIIQAHFGLIGKKSLILKELGIGKKLITMFHGYGVRKALEKKEETGENIYEELFKKGDFFLINCGYHEEILRDFGLPVNKSLIHYVGIDLSSFSYHRMPLNKKKPTIITVARLSWVKGLDCGLEALSQLKKEDFPFTYWLVGGGPLKNKLKKLANKLGISDSVKFFGAVSRSKVRSLLYKADIFFLPSLKEGHSLAIIEAMATGLPVVASDTCGIPEIVKEGETGYLAPVKKPAIYKRKLKKLINDPQKRIEIGRNAHNVIKKEFDINKLNNRLLQTYKKVLTENE